MISKAKQLYILLYGVIGYLIGLCTLLYMVGWLYPWSFMPTTIDSSNPSHNIIISICIDIFLITIFGIQHSLMVRESFKQFISKYMSEAEIRVTYTIVSSIFLLLIIIFWQPIDIWIWKFDSGVGYYLMTILYILGWLISVIATFQIDHFELFGLHQAYREYMGISTSEAKFQERGFYKFIRHPIQAGTILGIWATPQMSFGHLIFALIFTIYIFIGLYFEERDLIKTLGDDYISYKSRVPMIIPFIK